MRTSSQAVQHPDAKRGLCIDVHVGGGRTVGPWRPVIHRTGMHVYVRMVVPVVLVLVDVHTLLRRLSNAPEPDRDEHQSDKPLAPLGQALHRKDFAQKESRDAYCDDPAGVPQAPQKACGPRAFVAPCGERRHRCKMIGPREDMNGARGQAGDDGCDH